MTKSTLAELLRSGDDHQTQLAQALATPTSLPASWLEEQGRRGAVPSLGLGKYVRFNVAEALAAIRKLGGRHDPFSAWDRAPCMSMNQQGQRA